jgi:hypothetical protein
LEKNEKIQIVKRIKMKRLVLNMVCPMKTDPCDSRPLFLRDVGKYYWNSRTVRKDYGMTPMKCVENNLKMHRFFDLNTLLVCACEQRRVEIAEKLLKEGADVHTENDRPLVTACMKGDLEMVKLLVKNRANPHTGFFLPVTIAVENGHMGVYRYFEENLAAKPGVAVYQSIGLIARS